MTKIFHFDTRPFSWHYENGIKDKTMKKGHTPIPITKHLADRILNLSGEVQTLSMLFWQKCEEGKMSNIEMLELLQRLKQAKRELNSALEICEQLEKIARFNIQNPN